VSGSNYTQVECSTLFILMAEARRLFNRDLKELHRVELKKSSRDKLVKAGLIEVDKAKHPMTKASGMTLELTDRGWAWARNEITEGVPEGRAGQGQGALYAVLNNLARYLKRNQLVLADVFGHPSPETPAPVEADNGAPVDLEARVRAAYAALTRRPGTMVKLADLRERLLDVPRRDLDAMLAQLARARRIVLEANDDAYDVATRDREAALSLGDQQNHWMAVR